MSLAEETSVSRVFAVVNSHSGHADPERVGEALRSHLAGRDQACEIHDTQKDEDLTAIVRDALRRGFDIIVAAGGDGTVSVVANGLVGTDATLAIIPLGTTNVLARELGVPLDIDAACALVSGSSATVVVDGMKVGETCYFTQIGVGVDALMIHDTSEVNKRRMGSFAYVWTMLKNLVGYKSRRLTVTADDHTVRTRSLQVILANCGTLGASGLRWGPDVRIDDGRLDVCIFRPRSPLEYPRIAWNFVVGRHGREPRLTYLRASRSVSVQSDEPLPVQGDGEIITQTPLTVGIVRHALRVIVPGTSVARRAAEHGALKIVHLSDIHVWRYTWNIRRLVGVRVWWMLALLRGRAHHFQLERLDAVVERVRGLDPDHVLITGDLTTSALPDEFADVKRRLAPLLTDRDRITILPGNHDRATRRSSATNRFESAFGVYMPRLTFPWLRRLDDETAILGLDATRFHYTPRGRIPSAQLEQARALLGDPGMRPRRLIVASHYPIAAPPPYERELVAKRLENAGELADWLSRIGPHLFCCGHVHAAWAFHPPGLPDQLCLNSGAPLYRDAEALQPPGFLEIDLDADRVKVVHQAWDGAGWKPIVMVDERLFPAARPEIASG